jgi:hypothetical protein
MTTFEYLQFRTSVFEALNNADDNDYSFRGWDLDEIIEDLQTYDVDFEECDSDSLRPIVEEWYWRKYLSIWNRI